jgi:hypothetical protein
VTHDLELLVSVGILHGELEHEAVDLGLGQGVGALLLDGVLGGQHQEGVVQREGVLPNGDRVLLHRLQQRRLDLRRRAVDLVGEDHVGEDGPFLGLELLILGVVDQRADEVCGEQVRRELQAAELGVDGIGQGPHRERLGQARHPLHEYMAVGEQADEEALDHGLLAHDHPTYLVQKAVYEPALLLDLLLDDFDVQALGLVHGISMGNPTGVVQPAMVMDAPRGGRVAGHRKQICDNSPG